MMKSRATHLIRGTLTIAMSVALALGILRIVDAGSLDASSSPVGTLHSIADSYDALVGSSYDSSAVSADANGSALEIAKCIIANISSSGSCP